MSSTEAIHIVILLISSLLFSTGLSSLHPLVAHSAARHRNYTGISEFRLLNRRSLLKCPDANPYLKISVRANSSLSDDEYVTVNVSGVLSPSKSDWVAMITPSNSDVSACPLNKAQYVQTGDLSDLPLLCHYPVKAQYLRNDPDYLNCGKQECKKSNDNGTCLVATCSGSLSFHVVNFRTDIEFVLFTGGFLTPCILKRTDAISFANPKQPLYAHLNSIDSTGTSFRVSSVVSARVIVDNKIVVNCIQSPAAEDSDPQTTMKKTVELMRASWISGDGEAQQVQYGDGKSETSQVATFSQDDMCSKAIPSPAKDFGWHDPGYIHSAVLTGLQPSTSYSYKFGRDYIDSGSIYGTPDSGGECGVAYETYFPMPTPAKDKPWYSIEQGSIHFTVISTEHDWTETSEQYQWMKSDMASVDRSKTPWLVFMGHRPMYTSSTGVFSVDKRFQNAVEPLLLDNKVDLALFGHVHNYERTCSVYQSECKAFPVKDQDRVDVYDHSNYSAPVQAVIGMAGFTLDGFPDNVQDWSLVRISKFGYLRGHATRNELKLEFVDSRKKAVEDSFRITK
ncbi:hypothetical protein CDL15_Pgr026946 [Punica granatum]|uniref:Purple acid phosphatase n=1 Tax=Punica granatum TaxID=22663 RepID=A0A218XYE4_PUNGR|nr:hypothetical protein CDL15_Pgr026946 [Punica granatum]